MNKENKSQNSKLNIDAEESGCLSYFINHETLLNERYLTDLTNEFRNAGVKFGEEYETFISSFNSKSSDVYNHKMKKVEALYKMFCILKNQMRQKVQFSKHISELFYLKNLLSRVFTTWKYKYKFDRYLKFMSFTSDRHFKRTTMRNVLKSWRNSTMDEKKFEIKYRVARTTEREIDKIQKEYEAIIKNMENMLQEKMLELKKEEESHRVLFDRYESLLDKRSSKQEIENI